MRAPLDRDSPMGAGQHFDGPGYIPYVKLRSYFLPTIGVADGLVGVFTALLFVPVVVEPPLVEACVKQLR